MHRAAIVVFALAAACSTSVRKPSSAQTSIAGTVYLGGAERKGDPLSKATVTLSVEGDATPRATATTDARGNYRVETDVPANTRVIIGYRADGVAGTWRSLVAGPSTEVTMSVSLEPLEALDCVESRCLTESEGVTVFDVPPQTDGLARAFEPTTELPHLTGLELMRPLLVTWAELDGGTNLDAGLPPPSIQARLPFASWRRLDDDRPSSGALEVPVFRFDATSGRWQRDGEATLFTESGQKVPETALPAVREGNWPGGVVAVFPFGRAGYSTVALAAQTPGCVQGVVSVEGTPSPGAVLSLSGFEPSASGSDGTFCVAAPVSGGESATPEIGYAGVSYRTAALSLPVQSGSCTQAGTVTLDSAALTTPKTCKFTGTVVDAMGQPVGGAVVLGFDDTVPGNLYDSLCGEQSVRCPTSSSTDESGRFQLIVPFATSLTLTSTAQLERADLLESSRSGSLLLSSCPTAPVQLRLGAGRDKLDVAVTLSGTQLSWSPPKRAAQVLVLDVDGIIKQDLSPPEGVGSPYTLPAAPVMGDTVQVELNGTGSDGYQYSGSGSVTVE